MTTINLTNDQLQTICSALQANQDFFYDEIRKAVTQEEYESMMGCYEQLAGVKAIIDQALDAPDPKPATDALCKLSAAVGHGNKGREAIKAVLSQFDASRMADVHPSNYEKVVAACAMYASH